MTASTPDLVVLLSLALRQLQDELGADLDAAGFGGLRPAHGYALSRLSFGGATSVQVAEHLGITKQSAGQLVDELERAGYVRREPHPTDRRGKLLVLTDRGWACVRAAGAALAAIDARLTDRLGADRLAQLKAGLAAAGPEPGPWRGLRPPW
ncbi:MAG TPA: MarR family transcriptional regulator [Mycobacteriales bacterium]|nr:MarR family transcriptional regulator [Mycobacteriales bacterium]